MLPKGWTHVRLGDIAQISSGGTPDRSEPSYWGGDIPWVTTGEIQFNTITDTAEKISYDGLNNSSAKLFPAGTLLMAMYGQGKTRGQVARLGIEAATNQACAAICVKEKADADFIFQFLAANYDVIRELGNAGTQQNLSAGLIKEFFLMLPLRHEQTHIAKIASIWDAAVAASERLFFNSRRQKEALTHDLLMGRTRRAGFSKSSKRVTTKIGSLPQDWAHIPIATLASEVSVKNVNNEALPVLSCTKHHGLVDSLSYFKKRVFSEDISTYKLVPRGAFAYATNHIDEGSIGYQSLYDNALVSPMYTIFRANDALLNHRYLFSLLKTEHYRQVFAANINASVDRRGSLRWKEFGKIEIPVPSMDEQKGIVEILDAVDQDIEQLKAQVETFKREKRALMADLLTGKRRVRVPDSVEEPVAA